MRFRATKSHLDQGLVFFWSYLAVSSSVVCSGGEYQPKLATIAIPSSPGVVETKSFTNLFRAPFSLVSLSPCPPPRIAQNLSLPILRPCSSRDAIGAHGDNGNVHLVDVIVVVNAAYEWLLEIEDKAISIIKVVIIVPSHHIPFSFASCSTIEAFIAKNGMVTHPIFLCDLFNLECCTPT